MSKPPIEEPQGYNSAPGFVKSQPSNNEHYLDQFKTDPWYPILKETHERIEALIPGYNIAQIKEKWGGLRYYIDYPDVIPVGENVWNNTPEKIRDQVESAIRRAENWVDGFEYYRKNLHVHASAGA